MLSIERCHFTDKVRVTSSGSYISLPLETLDLEIRSLLSVCLLGLPRWRFGSEVFLFCWLDCSNLLIVGLLGVSSDDVGCSAEHDQADVETKFQQCFEMQT